ncbi:MAG TPA: S8 family peptidase [Chthonomonadaceae bacterium]|nr:S8 family peptidase [Chthonomonadaceae bacterium]
MAALAGCLLTGSQWPVRAKDAISAKCDGFLQEKLANRKPSDWVSAIVRVNGTGQAALEQELKSLGGSVYCRLPLINSVAVRVPINRLAHLTNMAFVDHLSEDTQVTKRDEFTVGSSGADVAFQQYGLTGSGVSVAVLDTGVKDATDLDDASGNSRIAANVSFVPSTTSADDGNGHGTHVAGIIAGNGAASTGSAFYRTFYGIARQTRIVNVRVLDANGQGDVSSVIAGIQWVVDNRARYNIRVINLSLGHPVGESYTTDPLCQAVEQAWKAGIVVVCAAGNEGRLNDTATQGADNEGYGTAYGSINSPGNDPYVITVGAMKSVDGIRANDTIATYSSRGPSLVDFVLKPDIVAPGNKVVSLEAPSSTLVNAYPANCLKWADYKVRGNTSYSSKYFVLSGTSMATPVVSGAAALLLQKDPTLSPDTVKARLMVSADKWSFPDGTYDACTFGAGYLNIPAALNCTVTATQSALSPSLYQDAQGNVLIDNAIWGNNAIWGSGITDLRAIWGSNAIWGKDMLSSSNAIWGKSVWTDRAIWGSSTSQIDGLAVTVQGDN